MKFGKEFLAIIEKTQPEYRDKFLSYKQLKKWLKRALPENGQAAPPSEEGASRELTQQEREFVGKLKAELEKFNEFFMEKEEDLVMLDKRLQDRLEEVLKQEPKEPRSLTSMCQSLAQFHGELVLLEHWCSLNYAALVKILKKHDKHSALALKVPILVSVLRQPFYSTEVLSLLVARTEERFHQVAGLLVAQQPAQSTDGAAAAPAVALPTLPPAAPPVSDASQVEDEDSMLRRTRAALSCWENLNKSQSIGQPFGGRPPGASVASESGQVASVSVPSDSGADGAVRGQTGNGSGQQGADTSAAGSMADPLRASNGQAAESDSDDSDGERHGNGAAAAAAAAAAAQAGAAAPGGASGGAAGGAGGEAGGSGAAAGAGAEDAAPEAKRRKQGE